MASDSSFGSEYRWLSVHHRGHVVSSSCGVEFMDMTSQVVFFPHTPSLSKFVLKVRARWVVLTWVMTLFWKEDMMPVAQGFFFT